ncbi:MAG TPA: ABC transporter ATP-binding protein [Microvirga sp.]|jgi:glycerol transport system ATP-binding protein|nr:ABC transporter ATP-binding protein [Microvirga sp.]
MARITLDRLAHAYKPDPQGPQDYALKEIHHVWDQGGAYALLGPSGCGKTTLLNIISGLVRPTRGRILFDDRDVTDLATEERNIAQVFQFPVVYDTMTVRENLAFPLKNRRVPRETVARRVEEIARMLDLMRVLDRKARNLTADMKQKISLGRGLVRPDVAAILFDEPLTVIDPQLKWQLRSTLKELHRALDLTMIYVTHDQTEALTFADKVVVMHDGAVVQTGTPEELFVRPAHTFVGHFIGSPGMNVLPCRVEGRTAYVEGQAIVLDRAYPALPQNRRIELGIRPEFAKLAASGGLPVRVRRIDDIGRARIARVDMAGRALAASVPESMDAVGEEATLVVDPRHIHIYADGHLVAGEGAR